MNGVLGAVCILVGCGGLWYLELIHHRERMEVLRQMASAMLEIHSEIQAKQTPLPRIIEALYQKTTGVTSDFFTQVHQGLGQELSLSKSWEQGVKQCFSEVETQGVLYQLGRSFDGDGQQICKVLLLVNNYFERVLLEEQQKFPEQKRSFGAMCFSGGALLLILLV